MNKSDEAFIELLSAGSILIQITGRKDANSLRVMLYKKLQAHIEQWDSLGYLKPELKDATVGMKVFENETRALITIIKRKPRLQWELIKVESDDTKVSADLEHNQGGEIQHGSPHQDSQEHGADTDTSSPQGEEHGQCSTPEDWQSVVRKFVEQDDDGSEKL